MKLTVRIPGEMYAYDEIEIDIPETSNMTAQDIQAKSQEIRDAFKAKPLNELPTKEMDVFIENILQCNMKNHSETWELMSPEQRKWAKTIDRTVTRLQARVKRQEETDEILSHHSD